ncbi:F-box protein At2g23160-like isoform X3 [Ananas comosus]|uniref:F-box protein At2g23160-like isoform X3 n=1 Tax=Ananas comosus TaxID=4615 RepID=A0A6P5GLL5_ANACO|nr:F-box protein At2g23160-like isoform X3 [Ananas comosus]
MDLHQVRKLEPTCKLVSKVKEPSLGILEEILSRLPTKSVLRLSCVSKLWHSIVSDPHFCNLHATRALVRDNHRSMLLIEGPVIENNSGTRIKTLFTGSEANLHGSAICHIVKCNTYFYNGTCNGLLIFRCDVAPEPIILCNPVTREYLYLSAGAPPFHDLESYFGLGFDPLRKVYKVFRFSLSRHSRKKDICEVYTLGSHGSWRRVCSDVEHFIFGPGLYIGGKIFWTTISYRHPYYMKIMSADVPGYKLAIYDTRKSSFENNSAPQSCYCVLPDVPKHWRIYGDYKPSLVSLKSFCGTRGILAATTDPILQGDHGEEEKSKTAFLRELHYILRETMSQDD